jgi:hypothetical protein
VKINIQSKGRKWSIEISAAFITAVAGALTAMHFVS